MVELIYKDIAPGAKDDISEINTLEANTSITNLPLLKEDLFEHTNYATLEQNQWKLDGTYKGIIEQCTPFWSTQVCADDATDGRYYFAAPITLTRIFTSKHTSSGVSFIFDNPDYCNYLNIKWYNDDVLVADRDYYPNSWDFYCQQTVELFNKVEITFYSMSAPNRFLKVFTIDDGVNRKFTDEDIFSLSILEEMSLISEELPINNLNTTIKRNSNIDYVFQKKQPLLAYFNGNLYGTFFVDTGEQVSKDNYEISAQDYKGILEDSIFYGGIYDGVTVRTILDEIFEGEKFTYTIEDAIADFVLYGHIPICTKREALAQVLFASCSVCSTARSSTVDVFTLKDDCKDIPSEHIYTGGSIKSDKIVTSVKISIHNFVKASSLSEVFKGDVVQGTNVIEFSEPIDASAVTVSGATLTAAYANYCIVEATAAVTVTIKAYVYTDSITTKTLYNDNINQGTTTNEVEIKDATLVSTSNADSVLLNVYEHYMKNKTLECEIIVEDDRCGDMRVLQTEWSGAQKGRIEQLEYDLRRKTIGSVVQRING